jgi:hypothetical protein
MADLGRLGPDTGRRFPWAGLLAVVLPLAAGYGSYKYVAIRLVAPLKAEVAANKKAAEAARTDIDKVTREAERMKREVRALQSIAKVEILWGGASGDKTKLTPDAREAKIAIPFTRNGSFWVSALPGNSAIWYYADEGDTLARIAAQPKVMGAAWLWPILATENNLKMSGTEPLAAGTLVKVPNRINEAQIRRAITEAGTPDKAKDEILAQAGLKP